MSDEDKDKQSIFKKAIDAGGAWLDLQIRKAKSDVQSKATSDEDDVPFYGKSVTDDPTYAINSQGYKESPTRILTQHLKQMALKDSVIAAIIQTRQNQVSNHSKLVKSEQERGWMLELKDEASLLEKIKEEMKGASLEAPSEEEPKEEGQSQDKEEAYNWDLERKAKAELAKRLAERRRKVETFILNAGELEERPFETKRWNLDSVLRAWVRDTLTYDFMATEIVPNQMGKPHHWYPVDGSTIKFSSPALRQYKMFPGSQTVSDLLYPEQQIQALEAKDALKLDDELLEAEKYKYVQVVKGRIERAYTEDEMKVGIRNITTDIYTNGYGIPELELLVSLVSSHLNTEYYNKSYFTQGFSAKGILHLKAPVPRRKLETIRQQWHHMIRGSRNSFQTPIFAGMDEIKWIPLTQNHSDLEFSNWLQYLTKMICAIYQIDPHEIGIGMKDEGKSGMSGDNTQQKIDMSKDKGLYPLLRFIENYININIINSIDSDFCFKFTGIDSEDKQASLLRQEKEVKFKKTVNEIRAEDGLPPLPGMNDVILDPTYMTWYAQFSDTGKAKAQQDQQQQQQQGQQPGIDLSEDEQQFSPDNFEEMLRTPDEDEEALSMEKSLKIEYYKL
jgi:hypothetical protein